MTGRWGGKGGEGEGGESICPFDQSAVFEHRVAAINKFFMINPENYWEKKRKIIIMIKYTFGEKIY